jgi:hypothetical protein
VDEQVIAATFLAIATKRIDTIRLPTKPGAAFGGSHWRLRLLAENVPFW